MGINSSKNTEIAEKNTENVEKINSSLLETHKRFISNRYATLYAFFEF